TGGSGAPGAFGSTTESWRRNIRRSGNTGITSWRSLLLIVPPTAPRALVPLLPDQEAPCDSVGGTNVELLDVSSQANWMQDPDFGQRARPASARPAMDDRRVHAGPREPADVLSGSTADRIGASPPPDVRSVSHWALP